MPSLPITSLRCPVGTQGHSSGIRVSGLTVSLVILPSHPDHPAPRGWEVPLRPQIWEPRGDPATHSPSGPWMPASRKPGSPCLALLSGLTAAASGRHEMPGFLNHLQLPRANATRACGTASRRKLRVSRLPLWPSPPPRLTSPSAQAHQRGLWW